MKKIIHIVIYFLVTSLFISCGKKSHDEKNRIQKLEKNTNLSEKNSSRNSELDQALRNDNLETFKTILKDNILDINVPLKNGHTFLMESIEKKSYRIRDFLIERGANLEIQNLKGETALIVAVVSNQLETVQILINKKVNLDKKNIDGDTALHLAIKNEFEDVAVLLVKSGANIKITDHDNLAAYDLLTNRKLTKLEEILRKSILVDISPPDMHSFKEIITSGDVQSLNNVLDKYPNLALTYEILNPVCLAFSLKSDEISLQMSQILLENNINPNGPQNSPCIPIIESIKLQKYSFLKLLLDYKAKTHILDKQNYSPLIHAILKNDLEIVKLLISHKALIEYKFITEEGIQEKIDACDIVRKVKGTLKTEEEKKINKSIKKHLNCGFWDWIF